jgi:hypothetical protein
MALSTEKRLDKVLNIIDKRLLPDEMAKKARGEVFTPLNLVRQMLFGLRKKDLEKGQLKTWGINEEGKHFDDDEKNRIGGVPLEVWRDDKSTFLDPANGIGNFPVIAFYMLDYQLGKHGKNKALRGDDNKIKRRKHIIQKMLYMIELNKGNVNTSRKIFRDIVPGVEPNIVCANTLNMTDKKLEDVIGINRFTVIMGNPPFNEGGTHQSGSQIWEYFLTGDQRAKGSKKYSFPGSIELLQDGGYLLFVLAQGWRTIAYKNVFDIIKKYQLEFLSILNMSESDRFPNINFPLDAFIIRKDETKVKSFILNEKYKLFGKVNISKLDFIPNYGWDIFSRWKEQNIETIDVKTTSSHNFSSHKELFQEKKSGNFKYPIIKTLNNDGLTIGYSSLKHIDQDRIKVLIAFGAYLYPTVDEGKYGVSQNVFYILCNSIKDAEKLKDYLEDKKVECLVNALKIASYAASNKPLSVLPNPIGHNESIDRILLLEKSDDIIFDKCREFEPKKRQAKTQKAKKGGASRSRFNKTRKNHRT